MANESIGKRNRGRMADPIKRLSCTRWFISVFQQFYTNGFLRIGVACEPETFAFVESRVTAGKFVSLGVTTVQC